MYASFSTKTLSTEYPLGEGTNPAIALTKADRAEAMAFLDSPSLHTAYLTSLIRDNGMTSPFNRGGFYGYRNNLMRLEGVALIGHAIIMEAENNQALRAFGAQAQVNTTAHLIMCDEGRIDEFWRAYAPAGKEMRRTSRHLLFELRWPTEESKPVPMLRLATLGDLNLLTPVHAEMAIEESGLDPRLVDSAGFAQRYSKRIEQGRTWVLIEGKKLLFKAEVICETPATTYIEGVWVSPDIRRRGYGRSCMSQLARMLLWGTKSLCLTVNDENVVARCFFKQAGYHLRSGYDTIFLK